MAAFYLIATLMVLQGLLFSYCETSVMSTATVIGSNTLPTAVQATPSLGGTETVAVGGDTVKTASGENTVTTAAGGGGGGTTVTTAIGGGGTATVTTAVGGAGTATVTTARGGAGTATVTTAVGGGGGGTVTITAAGGGGGATVTTASQGAGSGATVTATAGGGGGGANSLAVEVGDVTTAMNGGVGGGSATTVASGGGISSSKTATTITSSVAPEKEPGPTVILILIVTTNCSDEKLLALNVSVQIDIKTLYTGFPIKSLILQSISCSNSPIVVILKISFYSGIPSGKTIKGVFQAALKGGKLTDLTENNTIYTVTFIGVTLKYNPKPGQCQAICCGAGGALTVERVCIPENKCEGIEPDEKQEVGHCPKEEKGTCPDTCDDDGSGGIHNSPSYALVTLLAIATFKTMSF